MNAIITSFNGKKLIIFTSDGKVVDCFEVDTVIEGGSYENLRFIMEKV